MLLVGSCLALGTACAGDSSVSFAPLPEFSGDDDDPSGGTGEGPESAGSATSAAGTSETGGSSAMAGKGSVAGGSAGKSGGGGTSAAGSPTGGKSQGGQSGGGMSGAGTGGTGNGSAGGTETGGGGMNAGGGKGGTAGSSGGGAGGSAGGNGGGGYCPFGFFDGHTYAFCPVVDSATAAFERCKSLGMTLVTIESQAENAFVYAKQKSTWLGGTDEPLEGQWTWVASGELFTSGKQPVEGAYTNWVSGQPNNSDKDDLPENCLALSASGWNDVGCDLGGFKATCESGGPIIGPSPF